MRLPRLFPPKPFRSVLVAGHAWCGQCHDWKRFDVIPAVTDKDGQVLVPAFVICFRCGSGIDFDL